MLDVSGNQFSHITILRISETTLIVSKSSVNVEVNGEKLLFVPSFGV